MANYHQFHKLFEKCNGHSKSKIYQKCYRLEQQGDFFVHFIYFRLSIVIQVQICLLLFTELSRTEQVPIIAKQMSKFKKFQLSLWSGPKLIQKLYKNLQKLYFLSDKSFTLHFRQGS